jgi:3-hydroxyisobutyrate dehydrogenase-like beta-hydroxyacid dehydrogenase
MSKIISKDESPHNVINVRRFNHLPRDAICASRLQFLAERLHRSSAEAEKQKSTRAARENDQTAWIFLFGTFWARTKGEVGMNPITSDKNNLGFVGVGYMGQRIAQRLLESGFRLTAYDRDRSKAEELIRYGGSVAESIVSLSSSCDVVLSCLPTDEAVLSTYRGADGALANAHRGSLFIEMSTVYPETSQELSRLGSERGVDVLDVTISGSTPAAEQGALTLFGGGDQGCFDAAESIFRVIAHKYFYVGPSGSGATMKLVVNTLLGIGMQAIAEAVALGEKAGLDRNRLLDVLSQTAVVAPAHVGKLQSAMKSDYSPQFPIRLMNKDFGLILNLAAAVGARMPTAKTAFEINARQSDLGQEQDFSAVILQMEKQAHLDIRDERPTRIGVVRANSV